MFRTATLLAARAGESRSEKSRARSQKCVREGWAGCAGRGSPPPREPGEPSSSCGANEEVVRIRLPRHSLPLVRAHTNRHNHFTPDRESGGKSWQGCARLWAAGRLKASEASRPWQSAGRKAGPDFALGRHGVWGFLSPCNEQDHFVNFDK